MADGLDYLSADFDLNSLTVPRLRSILVSHDVPYPASAKKAQLIRILEEEVLPQAKKLLRERDRVKRTSAGITDMPSRATSVASDYDGQRSARDSMPPPPPTPSTVSTATGTRRGRSRMSTRASTADMEETIVPTTPSTATRRTVPRSETKRVRSELRDDGPATPVARDLVTPRKSTARKLRLSEVAPSIEPAPVPVPVAVPASAPVAVKMEPKEDSVFTDDNPFQSGSSPAPWEKGSRSVSRDFKRKSSGRLSTASPALSHGLRPRKSETPFDMQDDISSVATRSPFGSPAARPGSRGMDVDSEEDEEEMSEISAGEEFTPGEQLALERDQAELLYPPTPHRRRRATKQSTASKAAPWVLILSLIGSFGAWWRKEKIEIGYCGLGKPTWSLAETRVPEWASVLEPQCDPCPPHAFCYPNFEARCEHDFILKPHPLSLGGLVPLPPTCEPDSEKARRVKAVAEKAIEELRDRRAKFECGEALENGKEVTSPEMSESDLKQVIGNRRRKGMSDAEFDELWKGALGELLAKDEIVSKTQQPSDVLVLTSTSIARLPFTCAFRRYIRLSLLAYRLPLSILILTMSAVVYARSKVRARRSDVARVPELVATTLDRLATQAALHARGEAREPYIPIGQLRDDVLRFELRGKRREDLWKRVRSVVEGNANIRAAVREGRGGDVARVWEWIGGISGAQTKALESHSPRLGDGPHPLAYSSPSHEEARASADGQVMEPSSREARRWDEGRPVY
ncbi:putative sister chromatid separation protein (Src1) [Aspergillus clavatus NRRL 1]|uniref:Sister chromatid separation protein (Src1), putative n=1 Tax=Aspergillus clavatus (strain ATCC 1007 / CBS 513.65 / DSM 816 / NCTC 3887 / NRRL 1 / QM 1276 / 107) TaxID=344612 RepID=A1CTQ7_ASPCL|nr:sister chromatid separation protein (Src1), putative [Aspergillus clavatus NRRL 1]EAW06694.1 sister chromatid separation protein (Src1), putative [Aspergillus clavatus NRRL 1]